MLHGLGFIALCTALSPTPNWATLGGAHSVLDLPPIHLYVLSLVQELAQSACLPGTGVSGGSERCFLYMTLRKAGNCLGRGLQLLHAEGLRQQAPAEIGLDPSSAQASRPIGTFEPGVVVHAYNRRSQGTETGE